MSGNDYDVVVVGGGGAGSAVSWTTIPTQVTITSNDDNRIITGGSGTNLVGETELTYTGGLLKVAATYPSFYLDDTDTTNNRFRIIHNNQLTQIDADPNNVYAGSYMTFNIDGSEKLQIKADSNATFAGIVTATGFMSDYAGSRNMIINGDMQIAQRGTGAYTINSSSGQYPVDRWVSRGESSSKQFTVEQVSVSSSGLGVRNAIKVTSSQAASVGTNDIFNFRQMIEGYNTGRLNLGESGCASMTLSFTAYSSVAGTHSGAIQNSAQNRSYPFTYTLAQNTWTDVKITIPPITSGSFNETDGVGLRVVFDMGSGSGFRGTAGQWNSAQDEGATGAVRILETNGAVWYVTKVQLEEGTVATPFEKKLYGEKLRDCLRYYWQVNNDKYRRVGGYKRSDSNVHWEIQAPVPMRAAPSPTLSDGGIFTNFNSNYGTTQTSPQISEWDVNIGKGLLVISSDYSSTHVFVPSWEGYQLQLSAEI